MKTLFKIYEEAVKELSEDAVIATDPAAAGDPIEVQTTDDDDNDITANAVGAGVKDVLGKFDPNAGIGTDKDAYIPTKKRKKHIKDTDDLAPLPKKVEVNDDQGELLNSDTKENK